MKSPNHGDGPKKQQKSQLKQQQKKTVELKGQSPQQIPNQLAAQKLQKGANAQKNEYSKQNNNSTATSKNLQAKEQKQKGPILDRAMIEKYQIQIKEQILNISVSQIQSKIHLLKTFQQFFDKLKTQISLKSIWQEQQKNKYLIQIKNLTQKGSKQISQSVSHLEQYLTTVFSEHFAGFRAFLAEPISTINLPANSIYFQQMQVINKHIKIFSSDEALRINEQVTKSKMSSDPLPYWQLLSWKAYTPSMKNIVLTVYTFCKSFSDLLKRQKFRISQQAKESEKINSDKQIKQMKKKQQQMTLTVKQAKIKLQKQQLIVNKNIQEIDSLSKKIKILQSQIFNGTLQRDQIKRSLEEQKQTLTQISKRQKSCINTVITFAASLTQYLQQEVTNIDLMLSQESILDMSRSYEKFSCDESVLKIKMEQKDSIQEWSMLNDLAIDKKKQSSISTQQSTNLKQQITQHQSALRKIQQYLQQALAKIKNKYIKEILQRQKKLKQKYKNNPNKNSLIQSSHLKIQLSIAIEQKEATIKQFAEKIFELSQVNDKLQEISVQLEAAHETINNLETKRLEVEQKWQKAIQQIQGLRKIHKNHQEIIEDLKLQCAMISLNQEQREAYLVQKTLELTQLKHHLQNAVSKSDLNNKRLVEIENKLTSLQTEKQLILLANENLHSQIQNLQKKCLKMSRINTDYQFQIQELKQKIFNKNNQSLILQKITKADTSIEEKNQSLILQKVTQADISIEEEY